ncbi:DUF5683 domain-containing protein [Mucilaginibacter sp. Mucisp86]|uniref:DUF5683 domain-containing protein n=1 Tax=Mucilaginibacter sp. Mucisp86 TaxID=3243060 RepID=UPI0039B65382
MPKFFLFFILISFLSPIAHAQIFDKTETGRIDTTKKKLPGRSLSGSFAPKIDPLREKIYHPDSSHIPHKAVMRSLMIPGWGQVYNHRWWKVPLIYGGLGLLTSAIIYNQHQYKEYLTISRYRQGDPPSPGAPYYDKYILFRDYQVSDARLSDVRENSRRNRDLSIMGFLAVWGIQAIDAYIDAKFLHSYSVDNNLSLRATPGVINQQAYAQDVSFKYIPGIKITCSF